MNMKFYTFIFFLICFSISLKAQLFIDTSYTAEEMVMDFFDNSCVTPSNIVYTGGESSLAFFDAGNTNMSIPAGIYLSTGNVFDAIGPNTESATSGQVNSPGDGDLDNLLNGFQTYDASVLEFDIFVTGDQLDFSYIFASEEYPEFVNSGFNDIFAFFVSGPGISGLYNIAMVPNTSDPVSINTINSTTNAPYYVDNTNGQDISFDGFTTELSASISTMPNETYHIKIAIADVSDMVFDSGIFLGIESLCGDPLLVPPAQSNVSIDDMTVSFENTSRYATAYFWDFGDNTSSTERNPEPHTYAEEGFYDVSLITQNYCCSDTFTTMLTIGNPTSIEEPELKPYRISPNPFTDEVQIQFDVPGGVYNLKVFDASGKLLLNQSHNDSDGINLSNFVPGIYFAEIKSGEKVYREKLLKL